MQHLQAAVSRARREGLKIAIAGKRHSQGGHAFYKGALILDMTGFNKILNLDKERKVITVQSGATWEQIQDYLNPYGLAVKVMQASNIFTVGGSLSVNAHGRDPNLGSMIQTVQSFRLMKPDGDVIQVSRSENREIFPLILGGYGLFGIILDVDLEFTGNDVYEKTTVALNYKDYPKFFEENVRNHPEVGLHYARPSIADRDYLRSMTVSSFRRTDKRPEGIFVLKKERGIRRNRYLMSLSRKTKWGKNARWYLQELFADRPGSRSIECRNNAMRPEVRFLEYDSKTDTDILQEYFVPVRNFAAFLDGFRSITREEAVNLLSITVRYARADAESFLSYAREDSFAFVIYVNIKRSEDGVKTAQRWTQKLVDLALANSGSYYLPYQLYPTQKQIRLAYPMLDEFFARKKKWDPEELFVNGFYMHYRR